MKIVSIEEMRRLEREADAQGNTYAEMMERAGREVAEAAASVVERCQTALVVVLVGPGNNGGDGLVAARHLASRGYQVRVHLARPRADGDANWERLHSLGVPFLVGVTEENLGTLTDWLSDAGLVIDALLGTGARPPVTGEVAALLSTLRDSLRVQRRRRLLTYPALPRCPELARPVVLAVDVPSGLEADTGEVDPLTPKADLTVTMGLPKKGHFLFPGAAHVGQLVIADIGLPEVRTKPGDLDLLTADMVGSLLPERPLQGHKGTFGAALVLGGSSNYVGAPLLAAAAAARVGCGLVTVASIGQVLASADAVVPEATRLVLPGEVGVISPAAVPILNKQLAKYNALLIGPGLTQEKAAAELIEELLGWHEGSHRASIGFIERHRGPGEEIVLPPLVLDADALNLMAANRIWLERLPKGCVLTPHPGEMARLLNITVEEVQRDRVAITTRVAEQWQAVVVLKGAFTVIAEPSGMVSLAPFANPALASGGTGDVLAGALVSLLVQGLEPFTAARCAVYLHGLAGELAREHYGESGVVAGDLLPRLPKAMTMVRQGWW